MEGKPTLNLRGSASVFETFAVVSTLVFAGVFTLPIVMNHRAAAEEKSDNS